MSSWATVWAVVLVVSVTLFAVLAVVVTIGGYHDILVLLRRLQGEEPDDSGESRVG